MKSITVYFENEEFEKLSKAKGNKTWHNFVMELTIKKNNKNESNHPIIQSSNQQK